MRDGSGDELAPSTRRERLALAGLIAAFVITGLSVLPLPFTRDQGIYAYTAWRWLEGAVPYLHTFDHKGPLLYAIYALGLTLSRGAMWGPNLLDLVARAAAVWLTWALARRLLRGTGPLFAAALAALPLFGRFNAPWHNAQAETFMLPLVVASAWLSLAGSGRRHRPWLLALAGALAAQAVLLKPTSGLLALFLMGWLALAGERAAAPAAARPGNRWRDALLFAAGGLAGGVPWLVAFAAAGALRPMWDLLVTFNLFHAAGGSGVDHPVRLAFGDGLLPVFQIIPLLAVLPLLLRRRGEGVFRERRAVFAYGWLIAGALQVMIQGKFFLYHWVILAPPLALAGAAGLESLREGALSRGRKPLGVGLVSAALLWLVVANTAHWHSVVSGLRTLDYVRGRISRDQYWAPLREAGPNGHGDFNLLADAKAAEFARDKIPTGGSLLVFGFEPIVNWLARRPAPTRFEYAYPLTASPRSPKAREHRERWRAEFLADLRAHPPDLVMLVDNDVNPLQPLPSVQQATQWPEFRDWLQEHYEQIGTLEDFFVLQRKG